MMEVSGLFVYPIKSCGPISLESAQLTPTGLLYDREWMLVDALSGAFCSARTHPRLVSVSTSFSGSQKFIEVRMPNQEDKKLFLPLEAQFAPVVSSSEPLEVLALPLNKKEVRVWRSKTEGEDQGDQAAEFFSSFLHVSVRLVRSTDRVQPRYLHQDPKHGAPLAEANDTVKYADGFPFLLTTEESLAELNSRLSSPVPMTQFRPNIVVKGAQHAWEEDEWKRIRIGQESEFRGAKMCGRCKLTTVHLDGSFDPQGEPLATLKSYRTKNYPHRPTDSEAMFGLNLIQSNFVSLASLAIHDPVQVTERQ